MQFSPSGIQRGLALQAVLPAFTSIHSECPPKTVGNEGKLLLAMKHLKYYTDDLQFQMKKMLSTFFSIH